MRTYIYIINIPALVAFFFLFGERAGREEITYGDTYITSGRRELGQGAVNPLKTRYITYIVIAVRGSSRTRCTRSSMIDARPNDK